MLQRNDGICKVKGCIKYGTHLKRLDKHLKRKHYTLSQKQHDYLKVPVEPNRPKYMQYRRKEVCKLCQRTSLLGPHLRKIHKMSREDYNNLNPNVDREIEKNDKSEHGTQTSSNLMNISVDPEPITRKRSGTLHEAMTEIEKHWEPKPIMKSTEARKVVKETTGNQKCLLPPIAEELYPVEEMVRLFVHKMYSYQVIATGQAVQKKKDEDNLSIAQYLHGTCMNNLTIAECETAIELLPYLCQYFRFQRYYKYPKFPCVCLSDSCTPVDNTFILYCKRSCRETLNCKACKSFPRLNIHLCIDFFHCKTCDEDFKWSEKMRATNWKGY